MTAEFFLWSALMLVALALAIRELSMLLRSLWAEYCAAKADRSSRRRLGELLILNREIKF